MSVKTTPCWSVLEFGKIKLEKSSSTNWIFSLQKSISKLIFAGYTGSKNQVWNRLKIQFVELDFSKLIFQKSSTGQKGVRGFCYDLKVQRYGSSTKHPYFASTNTDEPEMIWKINRWQTYCWSLSRKKVMPPGKKIQN